MLQNFSDYLGMGEAPKNFKAFWQEAVSEANNAPLSITIKESDFVSKIANCYDVFFTSFDGSKIYAKYLTPKNAITAKAKMLLQFHGYTWNSGGFAQKLSYVSLGYSVLAMDCRGQSGLSEDNSIGNGNSVFGHLVKGIEGSAKDLFYRKIFLDTVMLAKVSEKLGETSEIFAMGDSQGGALALVCASLVDKIKAVVCYYPFLCDYEYVIKSGITPSAYEEISNYFKRKDPRHLFEKELYEKLAYIDVKNFTEKIKAEVLWICGGLDTYCPPKSQFAAYNRIKSKKELFYYPEYGHEIMPESQDLVYKFFQSFID